jgi:hypothetical protein
MPGAATVAAKDNSETICTMILMAWFNRSFGPVEGAGL